jgi:hypothetical protein
MSANQVTSKLAVVPAGEPTLFDSLARLVPEELQKEYYRVLAHTRTLSPDDEMLRILEAMGILALLTRHTPKDIADERERFQEMLALHQQTSVETQQETARYVHELESRLKSLPAEVETGLNPEQVTKILGESLRQHFLKSGISATVTGLQATNTAMTSAQRELSNALHKLSDSHFGVVAQIESANTRLTHSLESRAKTVDALLRELKADVLRIWIPMACGAALLIGLFAGIEIKGCRDASLAAVETPVPTVAQPATSPPDGKSVPDANSVKLHHDRREAKPGAEPGR